MENLEFSKQFDLIQQDRRGVVQSSVYPGIKELVSEIYPEEAHFIYELLQNAEDAKASSVYFEIQKTQLIFMHNGTKLFDAVDVDSITNIGKSTKKENYVQAGKFGIGFKSVYAFTDTPSIYCDSICFRIDQLLLPVQIEDLGTREKGWTVFRFPFDSPKISAENARKKIRQGLFEIESTTLLFLNNILRLDYKLEDGSFYSVVKEVVDRFVTCTMAKSNNASKKTNTWMRFSKDSYLGKKRIQVDIAFPMAYVEKEKKYDFLRGEDKVCIKFLAKNEKSNLRFYINAPFGCTPARDTVNKGDIANIALVKEIASLVTATITELRDSGHLTDNFFELLPLEEDNVPLFYQPIVDAVKKSFSDRKNLPTMVEGQYVTTENGIMSSRNVIDKIFTQKDIRTLYQNNRLFFVKNRPVNSRAYKFLKSLQIKELSPDSALIQMANIGAKDLKEWIQHKNNDEISDLYGFLSKGIDNLEHQAEKYEEYEDYATNRWYRYSATDEQIELGNLYIQLKKQIDRIKKISIVKTSAGDFTTASNVYLVETGVDVPEEFKVVAKESYKSDQAKRFLKSMGVKTFTQEELQGYQYKNEIDAMKSYLSWTQKLESQKEIDPLTIARKIIGFLKKHKNDEILWNEYRVVYARQSDHHYPTWHKVSDCCLDKPIIKETGLSAAVSIHRKRIVDDIYNSLKEDEKLRWVEFLKANGILWEIRVQKKEESTGYVTGYDEDYEITYLKPYLELHNIALARYIWNSLCKQGGWSFSYQTKRYKLNRNYNTHIEESSVLSTLKKTKWVPDINGIFRLPRDVSRSTIDTSFVINEENGFLAAIDFGANAKKQEEEEKARKEKEYLDQAQQVEAAKRLGFESTEAVLASKEDSKKIAKLKEYGIDVDELISNEEKKRKEKQRKDIGTMLKERQEEPFKGTSNPGYDPAAVVQNPERSKKKAENELNEAPNEPKKKVSVSKEVLPNKEEKQFLYNQYSGKCQVCSKRIIKKDGSYFFEAINLMNTSVLDKAYLTGLNLGWNSLCMCPNCAAEYKYGAISLYDFKDKASKLTIDSSVDDYIEFPIRMQGEERTIRYSPVHLLNLQTALNYFEKVSKGIEDDIEAKPSMKRVSYSNPAGSPTLIKKLDSGDRCPDCGTQNTTEKTISVIDNNGDSRLVDGLVCKCGTIYLTRRLYGKLVDPGSLNIVAAKAPRSNTAPKAKKIVVSSTKPANTSKRNGFGQCRRCGSAGTVFKSGLCWICYKDEMQSRYE